MTTDHSCGIIPVALNADQRLYLVVLHAKGHWSFPKGHPEGEEESVETAIREFTEETGLNLTTIEEDHPLNEHYVYTKDDGEKVDKTVVYFIGHADYHQSLQLHEGEINAGLWLPYHQARKRLTFDEARQLLDKAETYLNEQSDQPVE